MAGVFDFLRAMTEYWFRIKNGISWGTFWFQIGEYERVNSVEMAGILDYVALAKVHLTLNPLVEILCQVVHT